VEYQLRFSAFGVDLNGVEWRHLWDADGFWHLQFFSTGHRFDDTDRTDGD
jgi:hypothetical protein